MALASPSDVSSPWSTPQLVQQASLHAGLKMRGAEEIAGVATAQVWNKFKSENSGKQIPLWRWE